MSAPLSDDDRAQIRARAEAATPGPWFHYGSYPFEVCVEPGPDDIDCQIMVAGRDCREPDAAHIAGMDPATTLALLDERDNLAAEVETLRTLRAQAEDVAERNAEDAALWQAHNRRTRGAPTSFWLNPDGSTSPILNSTASASDQRPSPLFEVAAVSMLAEQEAIARAEAAEAKVAAVEAAVSNWHDEVRDDIIAALRGETR